MEAQFIPFVPRGSTQAHPPNAAAKAPETHQSPAVFRLINAQAAAPAGACQDEEAKPLITLHHEGERVTQIRIQCTCGHVIELDCVY